MPKGNFIDPADLYERASAVARTAVVGSSRTSYSLADIIDDDDLWDAIFDTAFLSVIPLNATLDGCSQALKSRDVTAEQVEAVQAPAPAETLVNDTDMATARRWLATTLQENLDNELQQLMILDHVVDNHWERHPARLSSLMLAVVKTADAALSQP